MRLVTNAAGLALCLAAGCSEGVSPVPVSTAVAGETDAVPGRSGEWALVDGSALVLAETGALEIRGPAGAIAIAEGVMGLPSLSEGGARFVFAHRVHQGSGTAVSAVSLRDGVWTAPRILTDAGNPDLVAISKDGSRVAFVAGANGIAAVWVVPFDGGAPLQLTNVDLRRVGKGPPEGFVPIPFREPPRFAADKLVWSARDGEHAVVLP